MGVKLSVITVCYNAGSHLEQTIRSVTEQTYPYIEYIIIDGGSTDHTSSIIRKYQDQIQVYVSEKDKGIYDAMNKGLKLASGDFVIFMNAGDEFYEPTTVQQVFAKYQGDDVIYGETLFEKEDGTRVGLMSEIRKRPLPVKLNWKSFRYGMNVGHQSIFVRRSLAPEYNLGHPFSADIDWIIRILKKTDKTQNCGMIVSRFRLGGTTEKNLKASLKDRYKVFDKHYGKFSNFLNHILIAFKYYF